MVYDVKIQESKEALLGSPEGRLILIHLLELSGLARSPCRGTTEETYRAIGRQEIGREIHTWFEADLKNYALAMKEQKILNGD